MASAVLCQSSKAVCVAKASKPARVARSTKVVSAKLTKANANVEVASAVVSTAVVAASSFHVWQPNNNKMFETFSYLPPLTDREIAKQVDYIVRNGWVPCLEFSDASIAYTDSVSCLRMGAVSAGYYDNRYWTMWKLPMFGCKDSSQVLREVEAATKAFPGSYVRLVAFDNSRQVQISGFLVHRPSTAKDWATPEKRSVKSF